MKEKLNQYITKHLLKAEIVAWMGSMIVFKYSQKVFIALLTVLALFYFIHGAFVNKSFNSENIQQKILGISASVVTIGFMFFYIGLPGATEQLMAGTIGLLIASVLSWVNMHQGIHKYNHPNVLRVHILLIICATHALAEGYIGV